MQHFNFMLKQSKTYLRACWTDKSIIIYTTIFTEPFARSEHVLRKIHHCTFRSQKLDSNFWTNFLLKKFLLFYPAKFPTYLFCHCTNSVSSLHILIHHCTFFASLHVKTSHALDDDLRVSTRFRGVIVVRISLTSRDLLPHPTLL